jgi:hypothetical protein
MRDSVDTELDLLARQLVGEPVLFAALTYPSELAIHFGLPVEFKGPRGGALVEGSYILGAVCSAWQIKSVSQGRTVVDYSRAENGHRLFPTIPMAKHDFEKFLAHLGSVTVRNVDVFLTPEGYGLQIGLSDGSTVGVFPTPDHFEIGPEDDIPIPPPDWELFTPFKRYLRVGPGSEWAYLPTDEAEAAKK